MYFYPVSKLPNTFSSFFFHLPYSQDLYDFLVYPMLPSSSLIFHMWVMLLTIGWDTLIVLWRTRTTSAMPLYSCIDRHRTECKKLSWSYMNYFSYFLSSICVIISRILWLWIFILCPLYLLIHNYFHLIDMSLFFTWSSNILHIWNNTGMILSGCLYGIRITRFCYVWRKTCGLCFLTEPKTCLK